MKNRKEKMNESRFVLFPSVPNYLAVKEIKALHKFKWKI